jgi:hypothetical protein
MRRSSARSSSCSSVKPKFMAWCHLLGGRRLHQARGRRKAILRRGGYASATPVGSRKEPTFGAIINRKSRHSYQHSESRKVKRELRTDSAPGGHGARRSDSVLYQLTQGSRPWLRTWGTTSSQCIGKKTAKTDPTAYGLRKTTQPLRFSANQIDRPRQFEAGTGEMLSSTAIRNFPTPQAWTRGRVSLVEPDCRASNHIGADDRIVKLKLA